ncbi:MAG: ATP-binding protein [Prosthecobacter sp.]
MPFRPVIAISPLLALLSWLSPGQRHIEAERQQLQQKLETLPPSPAPQAIQRLGWHTEYRHSPDSAEWVDLDLGEPEKIDSVVLIAPPPSSVTVEPGYGFPIRFQVELILDGEHGEEERRTIIADHTGEDFPNPGLLPVFIPAGGRMAQKIRITATRLYSSGAGRCFWALGEVMLLQGNRNLGSLLEAAGPSFVKASSSQGTRPDWGRINLVDGHTVLGPPLGTRPSPTLGFRSRRESEGRSPADPWVEVDLGSVVPLDEIRLFPAHPPEFAHSHGYGFPVRYQMELRETEAGAPIILASPQSGSYVAPPGDNPVSIVAGGKHARFVRLNALEPHVSNGSVVLAMAEMQVWSGGRHIEGGKRVIASDVTKDPGWSNAALVDGFASGAEIVDWPAWLAGLSQRREVEHQLVVLEARHAAIKRQWQRVGMAAAVGLGILGIAAAIAWSLRQRHARRVELEALRQRIARDLHDEIGSSLGSIALIAQDILSDGNHAQTTRADLTEIKEIANETVGAMRDIARLIQSDRYGADDLPTLLRETAGRMLRGIGHTLVVEDGTHTRGLSVDRQRDLILMFKETLHNVVRHAAASTVDIHLSHNHSSLILTVADNGKGFNPAASTSGMGLTNLQRRAFKHGGSVEITSRPASGTTLRVTLPSHV